MAGQLIISLTDQEIQAKQKESPRFPSFGFVLQMQLTALQGQTSIGSDYYETVTSSSDQCEAYLTVLEKKTSQPKIKYRQKW